MPETQDNSDTDSIMHWVRWSNLIPVLLICLAAFIYYPVWVFDQRWQKIQIGATADQMKQLLGEPGEPSYRVGTRVSVFDAYVYRRYWKTYEVLVDADTQKVVSKSQDDRVANQAQPFRLRNSSRQ